MYVPMSWLSQEWVDECSSFAVNVALYSNPSAPTMLAIKDGDLPDLLQINISPA